MTPARRTPSRAHGAAGALAAFIASEAFVMVHAERVLDRSGGHSTFVSCTGRATTPTPRWC
jgi:hypothetical protein